MDKIKEIVVAGVEANTIVSKRRKAQVGDYVMLRTICEEGWYGKVTEVRRTKATKIQEAVK